MIAVIADDLTGAAELAGIGLRYFSKIKVFTDQIEAADADLIVVSTDSRSMPEVDAVRKTAAVTARVAALQPKLIFKKVDSALRGHVAAEIEAQLKQLALNRALLVPANPALGRKIIKGIYYLHEEPIHLTAFSRDPEFPVKTSVVSAMLTSHDLPVHVLDHRQPMPSSGIIIGEAQTTEELRAWAEKKEDGVLLGGGSGFFTAVMNSLQTGVPIKPVSDDLSFKRTSLFVCGSAYNRSIELVKSLKKRGGPVSYIPVSSPIHFDESWRMEVFYFLTAYGQAVIALDPTKVVQSMLDAKSLREATAAAVHVVYNEVEIKELIVEGGSTASAIIKKLGLQTFSPVEEISTGVVRMKVQGTRELYLTIKPGSYEWSKKIWDFKSYDPGDLIRY